MKEHEDYRDDDHKTLTGRLETNQRGLNKWSPRFTVRCSHSSTTPSGPTI